MELMTSSCSSEASHSWGELGVWSWGLEAPVCLSRLNVAEHNSIKTEPWNINVKQTRGAFVAWIYVFSHVREKFGESPCSSLMVLCTRGVHAGGDETRMPPLGRVESSEEVLTRTWTVSIGGMTPRLTTNTVLSRSSSSTMCPATPD